MTELTINLLSKCWTIHNRGELTVSGRVGNILHVSIYPPSITVRGPWNDWKIPLDKITIVRDGSHLTSDPQPDTLGGGGQEHSTAIDPNGIWSLLATNKE